MEVSDAKKLRALEEENPRLKERVADLSLDKAALTTVIRKKRLELVSPRRDVALVMAEHAIGERYVCKLPEVDRSTYRYELRPHRNAKVREASGPWQNSTGVPASAVCGRCWYRG